MPNAKDRGFLESSWFCPRLFSALSMTTLTRLLSAVLLEKSIVFVGKQSMLSSAILGLNSLLHPFKWCLALVPILPHPLIEMLEAPLPLLVGISRREYKDVTLTQEERDSKIWVFLDSGEVLYAKDQPLVELAFNIDENLYSFFKDFQGKAQASGRSLASDVSQVAHDDACRAICESIRKQIKAAILDHLKQPTYGPIPFNDIVETMGNLIIRHGRREDSAFL